MTVEQLLEYYLAQRGISEFMPEGYSQKQKIIIDETISALQLLIPKKPINETGYYRDNKCPNCNSRLKSGQGSSSKYRNNFCNKCGQKIDWRE